MGGQRTCPMARQGLARYATTTADAASRATWDVVVIGAGPAGSLAARELARDGRRVLLVDRNTFPRDKVCGCCLSGAALNALDAAGLGSLADACGARPLRSLRFTAVNRSADLALAKSVSLSRARLDTELVGAAIHGGADFLDNTRAIVGSRTQDECEIELKTGSDRTTVTARIGRVAGGLGARAFAEPDERQTAVGSRIGAGVVLPGTHRNFSDGVIHMLCHRSGYVGMVLLEDGRLDIAAALDGLAVKRAGGIAPLVCSILQDSKCPLPADMETAEWHGTTKLTQYRAALYGNRYFVVGDAAGYVEPFTGEGIGWAMTTGRSVVPYVIKALQEGTECAGPWWEKRHRELLGQRMRMCRLISGALRYPKFVTAAVGLLSFMPGLAKPFINAIDASLQRDDKLPRRELRGGDEQDAARFHDQAAW